MNFSGRVSCWGWDSLVFFRVTLYQIVTPVTIRSYVVKFIKMWEIVEGKSWVC